MYGLVRMAAAITQQVFSCRRAHFHGRVRLSPYGDRHEPRSRCPEPRTGAAPAVSLRAGTKASGPPALVVYRPLGRRPADAPRRPPEAGTVPRPNRGGTAGLAPNDAAE